MSEIGKRMMQLDAELEAGTTPYEVGNARARVMREALRDRQQLIQMATRLNRSQDLGNLFDEAIGRKRPIRAAS